MPRRTSHTYDEHREVIETFNLSNLPMMEFLKELGWLGTRFFVARNGLELNHIKIVTTKNTIILENLNVKGDKTAMKYLVCRTQALRTNGRSEQMGSSMFPIVVESFHYDAEEIVKQACGTISQGYVGMHEYVVVPMEQATVVSFRPRTQYDVSVRGYDA